MGSGIKKKTKELSMKEFLEMYDIEKRHRDSVNAIEGALYRATYQDPILKNFKFVIFEGGDFSGKSTQAKRLAQHYNKCMVVHFPRTTKISPLSYRQENSSPLHVVSKSTKDVYDITNNYLYNDEFWTEFFYELEKYYSKKHNIIEDSKDPKFTKTEFGKKDELLRMCLDMNIYYNYIDKISFFVELVDFIKGDNISLEFNDDYSFYMDGKQVTDEESIKEVIDSYRNNKYQEHVIIFDRFILSGKIYNNYIPKMWIINKFVKHFNTYNIKDPITVDEMVKLIWQGNNFLGLTPAKNEFIKYSKELFEENFDKFNYMCDLLNFITEKQSECDHKLVEYLNNLTGFDIKYTDEYPSHGLKDTFNSAVKFDCTGMDYSEENRMFDSYNYFNRTYLAFKDNTLNTNFINVNCYRSEKILEQIKENAIESNRKVDSYDKNTLMQEVVNRYFDECKKMSNDISKPIQDVNIFKTDEKHKENLYLNTLNIDSDRYYDDNDDPTFDNKETMIDNISACISIYIQDYKHKEDDVLISYWKDRDCIRYMNY